MSHRLLFTFILIVFFSSAQAQDYYLPLNREWNLRYEPYLQLKQSNVHTSIKPLRHDEIIGVANIDSLDAPQIKETRFTRTLVGRKIFKEHLVQIRDSDFVVHADFVFEGRLGNEMAEKENLFTNTRGFWIGGTAGKRFSFSTTFSKTRRAFLPTLIRLLCDTASFPERDVSNGSMEAMIMPTYQAPFLTPSTATSMCSLVTTKILLVMDTAHSYFQTMLTDIRFLKSIPLSGK